MNEKPVKSRSSFSGFLLNFEEFKNLNNHQQRLLSLISINTQEKSLDLKIGDETDEIMSTLEELLSFLQPLSLNGVSKLTISFSNFHGKVKIALVDSIHQKLSQLQDILKISVLESNSLEWDPHSFFLFSTFQQTRKNLNYLYQSDSNNHVIQISQHINPKSNKLELKFIYDDDFEAFQQKVETGFEKQDSNLFPNQFLNPPTILKVSFSDFFSHVLNLIKENYQQFQANHLQIGVKDEVTNSIPQQPPQITETKKKITLELNIRNKLVDEKILSTHNLFQIWELESHRITKINLKIIKASQEQPNLFMTNPAKEKVDLSNSSKLTIFQKTFFEIPFIILSDLNLLFQLIKYSGGVSMCTLAFTSYSEFFKLIVEEVLAGLANKIENEFNISHLRVTGVGPNEFLPIIKLAESLPKLNSFQVFVSQLAKKLDRHECLEKVQQIISKFKRFNLDDSIVLEKNGEFKMKIFDPFMLKPLLKLNYFLNIISSLKRSIHFSLIYHFNLNNQIKDNLIAAYEISRQINKCDFVSRFLIENCNQSIPQLEIIQQQRQSAILSIIPFLNQISDHMTFSPLNVLLDLFVD